MNKFCVYKHTSPSGKVYIGLTGVEPEKRWANGKGYRGSYFGNAIKKYGWENIKHEILFDGLSCEEAILKEAETIAFYNSTNPEKGYNVAPGSIHYMKGENHPLYGKKRPPEVLEKMRLSRVGKPWSTMQRKAMEEYYATHHGTTWGHKYSLERRQRLSEAHIGQCRPHKQETIDKITEANKHMRKPVLQLSLSGEVVAVFESITAAGKTIREGKVPKENIRQCCHGQKKTAYGYKWVFAEEVDTTCTISNSLKVG